MKRKKTAKKSFYEEDLDRKAMKGGHRKEKTSKKRLSIYDNFDEEDDLLLEHYYIR